MNRETNGGLRTVHTWGYQFRCAALVAALTLCLAPLAHAYEEGTIASHCPHDAASAVSHCAWHCGVLGIQDGGQEEISADFHVSRVWSLGGNSPLDTVLDGEFPPRGPPHVVCQVA